MTYSQNTFVQCNISILANNAFTMNWGAIQITKSLVFGENYLETSTSIVIQKSDIGIFSASTHAESLLVAMLKKWSSLKLEFGVVECDYKGAVIKNGSIIHTFWINCYDKPRDAYGNFDQNALIDPDGF
ncbi:hypothetical protein [uncultured Nostoc sp.]|uniref:hypothetical protein n=1 Tax=uncultured Nostoc sp. TaxID=340711 RepID=UPI0035CC804C